MRFQKNLLGVSFTIILICSAIWSCDNQKGNSQQKTAPKATHTFFQLLTSDQTGVDFTNTVQSGDKFNVLTYRNFYNGGGVAIGDLNNDGLPDLYFTANQGKNKLFLNKGNFTFEDITEQAGVGGTKGWSTGATMADVNGDGWLDIYVSNSGDLEGEDKENELFINHPPVSPLAKGGSSHSEQGGTEQGGRGIPTFSEQAEAYGLNDKGYSTQAAFFDYDQDGDLDCYILNNSFKDPSRIELYKSMREERDELGGDKLLRNDGIPPSQGGTGMGFTDVTTEAGIYSSEIGFGLGAAISDINHDFLPDIYVSNDFWERDYLYINQGDGTFSEELIDRIDFCSVASMGGDIADINNDGHPEIFSTDMLAADNFRLQAMTAFDPYHLEDMKYRANYHYQMVQNCLHLNDGTGDFQEISLLSGVAATDWSWGALIFDFENDGNKDIFVSNGITRDLMYMDFVEFLADNNVYKTIARKGDLDYDSLISKMPSNALKNFAFQHKGDLQFVNQADKLGLGQPSFSNGAAYGDLDNDGDLDLVINNVNMPCFIYQNEAENLQNQYLKVTFKGYAQNLFGIGTQVDIKANGVFQTLQNYNSRGFESCIESHLLFGVGAAETIEEVKVIWPDQKMQILTNVSANQTLTVEYTNANLKAAPAQTAFTPLFEDVSKQAINGNATHHENRYNDFDHEGLLLNMLSTEGPELVTGDVNNDGREDFLLLGATDDEDKLFIQTAEGTFQQRRSASFTGSKMFESTCGAFFDQDGDGDLDLMLGSGGNEAQRDRKYYILRYYENDGKGNFSVDNANIPQVIGNFSVLKAEDFDQDGDADIFLGGRVVPGNYGLPPRSFLFVNDNGKWKEVAPPPLAGIGMVTDASWTDVDGDQDKDLVVVGDWMAIQIFKNENGTLMDPQVIPNSEGWWQCIEPADLDQDGDMDFVVGNWGLNTKFKASPAKPLTMYVNDFDRNEKSEFIINWYPPLENQAYPFATKPELTAQLPGLRKSILKYADYAAQTYESLFPADIRQSSIPYQATWLESAVLWNENNSFSLSALPVEAQVAPVCGVIADDLDGDGRTDIWLGGNFYGLKPQVGRHDASRGVFLAGTSDNHFRYVSPLESGMYIQGEVRDAAVVQTSDSKMVIIARNNASVVVFKDNNTAN